MYGFDREAFIEAHESDTLESLTTECHKWQDDHKMPPMCMFELSAEIGARLQGLHSNYIAADVPVTPEMYDYAIKFCERWWAAEDREDGSSREDLAA